MVSKDARRWRIIAHLVMIILSALALAPFALLIISSLTEEKSALRYGYSFIPKQWSFDAYGMTILITLIGTGSSIIITALMAYVLSKKGLPGGRIMNLIVIFTMLFNGGLVATYISYVTYFHIKNNL